MVAGGSSIANGGIRLDSLGGDGWWFTMDMEGAHGGS